MNEAVKGYGCSKWFKSPSTRCKSSPDQFRVEVVERDFNDPGYKPQEGLRLLLEDIDIFLRPPTHRPLYLLKEWWKDTVAQFTKVFKKWTACKKGNSNNFPDFLSKHGPKISSLHFQMVYFCFLLRFMDELILLMLRYYLS